MKTSKKKLQLKKIKISKLTDNTLSQIYGGTQGNNGCGGKTKLNDPDCPKELSEYGDCQDTRQTNCP